MKPHIIAGLDIGTATVKVLAAVKSKKDEGLEVLAYEEAISSGVRKGVVVNPSETAFVVQSILKKIEEKIKRKVEAVYVNVGGSHIFSALSRGLVSVSRADQKISQEDIERVLQAAQTFPLPSNREILEVFPREFIVDGQDGIREAQGLQGVRLEAEVLVLGGFSPYLKSLTAAVLNSDLQINDMIFSPIASSRAVLTSRERELGAALLDIGAGTTGFAVFEENDLIHVNIFPVGSSHITSDIAVYLKSDIETAERIKLEFGTLFTTGKDKKEKIEIDEGETLVFSPKKVSKVIEDRIVEIFREVSKELKKIGKQTLPSGIVLTGGGARLPKIKEMAKKEFRLPCRIGRPIGLSVLQDDSRLAAVCGLVLQGADLEFGKTAWGEERALSRKGIGEKIKKIFKIFVP